MEVTEEEHEITRSSVATKARNTYKMQSNVVISFTEVLSTLHFVNSPVTDELYCFVFAVLLLMSIYVDVTRVVSCYSKMMISHKWQFQTSIFISAMF